ncbi:hypothetical protein Asppvi_010465 [Aspergillus pseudoviridinutans]|uniref:Uncharacterized protein n=1 Tax=Aspergillus pseudoviridinutans TaxID=1517512 RepID=A0A9P3BPF8_9EURO|nr:uncharacterized protein Asppvi_010465 [Aspergillus pseudoviridinutans]GIJ91499.1 hypothetical protein Asppvi_010465 [Aspergillus pseudoviridinutans]
MSTNQAPYQSSIGGYNQDPNSTTPIGTNVNTAASTGDPFTGPASKSAGPHNSNIANTLDPRVDSDMNNRAQYAPGMTSSGNVHPGATQSYDNPYSSNAGPHSSSVMNKLDPRVDSQTGNTTTKTTNDTGTGAYRNPTDTSGVGAGAGAGAGITQGSSTTSVGTPGVEDNRSRYDPNVSGYNPATGSGYSTTGGVGHQPAPGSSSYDNQDYRAEYAPSTENKQYTAGGHGRSATKGEEIGRGVRSAIAGVHGAGESLRGAINTAVDKAFGHEAGAAKNQAIANKGEQEIRSGTLSGQRETR